MNNLVIFSFGLLVLFACSVAQDSHTIEWGEQRQNDRLLDREIVVKKYKFLRIVSEDFKFPKEDHKNNYTITAIRCTDQYTDGDGGYATLLEGGVGYKNVTIHLKSRRNHGYNFIIEIFGQ